MFLLLISTFVLDAVVTDPRGQTAVLVTSVAALLLTLRVTGTRWIAWPLLRGPLSVASLVLVATAAAAPGDVMTGVLALWLSVVLAATIVMIILRPAAASCGQLRPAAASCGQLRPAAASCGQLRPGSPAQERGADTPDATADDGTVIRQG